MPNNSNNFPLVSVIMNCYNGQIYLAEAVKSVLSQTYENFEVIFWDNQSKDKSAIIYKSIKDIRLKYYYANKHTSLYKARNLAIQKAKGRSSRKIQLEFPELGNTYWGKHFWARGYFSATSGGITDEAVTHYINNHSESRQPTPKDKKDKLK